jgi:hypothetical protein
VYAKLASPQLVRFYKYSRIENMQLLRHTNKCSTIALICQIYIFTNCGMLRYPTAASLTPCSLDSSWAMLYNTNASSSDEVIELQILCVHGRYRWLNLQAFCVNSHCYVTCCLRFLGTTPHQFTVLRIPCSLNTLEAQLSVPGTVVYYEQPWGLAISQSLRHVNYP